MIIIMRLALLRIWGEDQGRARGGEEPGRGSGT
jgi:hypothetical protein